MIEINPATLSGGTQGTGHNNVEQLSLFLVKHHLYPTNPLSVVLAK